MVEGDLLHAVDGIGVRDKSPTQITALILGAPGSLVELTCSRPGAPAPQALPRPAPRASRARAGGTRFGRPGMCERGARVQGAERGAEAEGRG